MRDIVVRSTQSGGVEASQSLVEGESLLLSENIIR
jgi:hypothetical protein